MLTETPVSCQHWGNIYSWWHWYDYQSAHWFPLWIHSERTACKLNSHCYVFCYPCKHWTAPSAEVHNPLCCVCVSVAHDNSLCSSSMSSHSSLHCVGLAWLTTLMHRQPWKVASRLTTLMDRRALWGSISAHYSNALTALWGSISGKEYEHWVQT